jgi:hypothetical protein
MLREMGLPVPEPNPDPGVVIQVVVSRTPFQARRFPQKPIGPVPPVLGMSNQRWSRRRVCGILPPVMTFIRVAAQTLGR